MKWRIPVTWQMQGTQEIEADRLEDAMNQACVSFNATDGEFMDGTLELDCYDVDAVRSIYNRNRPDYIEKAYPELKYYGIDDNERDLCWDEVNEDPEANVLRSGRMGQYRIIFEVFDERYYCNVEALNIVEALGAFFREHPHITYDMIVDHVEI